MGVLLLSRLKMSVLSNPSSQEHGLGFLPTETQEGPANANTAVLDLVWIDELPIVVTLLNPGQRRTSKRLNLYMQRCLGRHLANSRRRKRWRKRRTPGRKLQLGHLLSISWLSLLTQCGAMLVRVTMPLT